MYKIAPNLDVSELRMVVRRTDKNLLKKLKSYLNLRIHLRVEEELMPIACLLKEVGRDYIVAAFGENERIVPIDKIIFIQVESTGHYPYTL